MRTLLHAVALGQPNATGPPGAGYSISRTTTESSAKNRSAAVLTTTTPSTETIMATTTLTLPAAEAIPASAQSFGTAHGTILALDLGTHHWFRAPHRRLAPSSAARCHFAPTAGKAAV